MLATYFQLGQRQLPLLLFLFRLLLLSNDEVHSVSRCGWQRHVLVNAHMYTYVYV